MAGGGNEVTVGRAGGDPVRADYERLAPDYDRRWSGYLRASLARTARGTPGGEGGPLAGQRPCGRLRRFAVQPAWGGDAALPRPAFHHPPPRCPSWLPRTARKSSKM